jgi:DNA polymerase delta subunit 1
MTTFQELCQRSVTTALKSRSKDVTFQAISWYGADLDISSTEGCTQGDAWREKKDGMRDVYQVNVEPLRYFIKIWGTTSDGKTVSVTVNNFRPYFWVKIPDHANQREVFTEILVQVPGKLQSHIQVDQTKYKQDVWGFTNKEKFKFMKLSFQSLKAFYSVRGIIEKMKACKLYESNIDPYIRFIHLQNLEPTGWIQIPANAYDTAENLQSNSQIDIEVSYEKVKPYKSDAPARFLVASFDIECTSHTGAFPLAIKKYDLLSSDLLEVYKCLQKNSMSETTCIECIQAAIMKAFFNKANTTYTTYLQNVKLLSVKIKSVLEEQVNKVVKTGIDDIMTILKSKREYEDKLEALTYLFTYTFKLPTLDGDEIIQIGTTFHYYGDREVCFRHIVTLDSCDPIKNAHVEAITGQDSKESKERRLLLAWAELIQKTNPDIMVGYNIFGFDMNYIFQRACELNIKNEILKTGRFPDTQCKFVVKQLSSSALGDNILKYIDMHGRVLIDVMKVVQRDHRLDSYKLDLVAQHFLNQRKNDVSPAQIFQLQSGSSSDRSKIADYCLQDCSLCNYLVMKLELIASNMGMSNVCLVPLSYIFMRGQGIKIFSLVLKQCMEYDYLMPTITKCDADELDDDSYEGAIVLHPQTGIYIDTPVAVLDYASLYPSSMISENLSHDCIVLDQKYDNLPNVKYLDIKYDQKVCRFVQLPDGEKGLIPQILEKLLNARKATRKKMGWNNLYTNDGKKYTGIIETDNNSYKIYGVEEQAGQVFSLPISQAKSVEHCFSEFQLAVLDGLQLAYKVTANSLYGQIGARTSPIYLKDIAACTTATGRNMIMTAKKYIEDKYPTAKIIYGDTDSVFVQFETVDDNGNQLYGQDAREKSWNIASQLSCDFRKVIKRPHDLEVDKIFHPFILLSKKRYVGNKYEGDMSKFKQTSMGIVLKRRDYAPIVKKVYKGIIDVILNQHDVKASIEFLNHELKALIEGNVPLEELIITKSLKADYKNPTRTAHKVLAERIGDRDPGNKPMVNDRIPFVYVETALPEGKKKILQGERIEHPDYIKKNNLKPDYAFYITNQIMKPVSQVFALAADQLGVHTNEEYEQIYQELMLKYNGNIEDVADKFEDFRMKDVKSVLFDPYLLKIEGSNEYKKAHKPPTRARQAKSTIQTEPILSSLEQKKMQCDKIIKSKAKTPKYRVLDLYNVLGSN